MAARLKVGDEIAVTIGTNEYDGRVIEDRGNIGVGGRQLVRIRLDRGEPADVDTDFEIAAVKLRRRAAVA